MAAHAELLVKIILATDETPATEADLEEAVVKRLEGDAIFARSEQSSSGNRSLYKIQEVEVVG